MLRKVRHSLKALGHRGLRPKDWITPRHSTCSAALRSVSAPADGARAWMGATTRNDG